MTHTARLNGCAVLSYQMQLIVRCFNCAIRYFCVLTAEREVWYNILRNREIFDLPTELQWEIAARAGQTGEYGWYLKNGVATQGTLQNVGDFSWNKDNAGGDCHPVGGKAPNLWGIYDTSGEEWEWCRDEWNGNNTAYHGLPAEIPYSAGGASANRIFRGGYYASGSNTSMRPSLRNSSPASEGPNTPAVGVRLCCIPGGRAVPEDATGTPLGAASAVGDAMVVDVSAGASAANFPVAHYCNIDMGYFNCDTYKTTKIAFRKVKAGTYTVGDAEIGDAGWLATAVTVNKDYYIGLFPVTWRQWYQTAG